MPSTVYLVVTSPDAQGGIASATATLANHLAETRPVEMICLYRRGRGSRYPLDERVKVRCILDEAEEHERPLEHLPTQLPGGDRTGSYNALVDLMLPRVLQGLGPGIVISTRAIFHLEIVKHVPAHCITIGQDHTNLEMRDARSRNLQSEELVTDIGLVGEAIGRLDQYVVLTEADAQNYRDTFPQASDKLTVIRNPAPWPVLESNGERRQVVVAAGKLGKRKRFDVLIEAYKPLAQQRPDWQLHIYGEGTARKRLTRIINHAGLQDLVFLQGHTSEMERVLEEASIVAMTSKFEGLPMVLIEAMTKGAPIVSFDCPHGPAEIVVDGVTGRLVPNNDKEGFTAALLQLMDDPELRSRMSEESLRYAGQYQVDRVTQNWLDLFDSLEAARANAS